LQKKKKTFTKLFKNKFSMHTFSFAMSSEPPFAALPIAGAIKGEAT
jgi:hypothetical protein